VGLPLPRPLNGRDVAHQRELQLARRLGARAEAAGADEAPELSHAVHVRPREQQARVAAGGGPDPTLALLAHVRGRGVLALGLEVLLVEELAELPKLGLKDEVWPKFLRENALRVLNLPS